MAKETYHLRVDWALDGKRQKPWYSPYVIEDEGPEGISAAEEKSEKYFKNFIHDMEKGYGDSFLLLTKQMEVADTKHWYFR